MADLKLLPLCASLALVAACSQPAVKASQPASVETSAQRSAERVAEPAAVAAEKVDKAQASLPKQPLTPDILFKFLVAEVAGQRGAIGIAQSAYLDLARQTHDPRIARRAAEVSAFARDGAATLEATRLWAAADPDSSRAQQTLAALLLGEGKFGEAEPILRNLLKQDGANGFMNLAAAAGKVPDPQAMFALVERLAADRPDLPEARFAVAEAAAAAGRFEAALAALQQADRLRPGWETAALLRLQLLGRTSQADALAFMRTYLAAYPASREVRLAYARALVNDNQFGAARAEFTRLADEFPRNADVGLAAGLLSLQMGDAAAARDWLTRTLEYGPRDPDAVYFYLGQAAEQLQQPAEAAAHYAQIIEGHYLVPARSRQAALLAKSGKLAEARALLAATRGENETQNVRLIQAQAELLRDNKAHTEAFSVLSDGLKRYPDNADLLYDRAMAAEKLGRLDVVEADLRRVIGLRPNDAQAYNALGYTLADRTTRLAEAVVLLDKALSLAPEDPFILDSAGWAQYRLGNLVRAQDYLERAFKARPDPEIAAHLGEVLWARGQHDEAGKLWRTSLQTHPQNEVLLETVRRFEP